MIYTISDMHGCLEAFEKRLAQINAELETYEKAFCGNYRRKL